MTASCQVPLNLLLFTVGGIRFGCDADQATGTAPFNGEDASDLCWFHEEVGFAAKPVTYHAPTIVSIRTGARQPYRVVIDALDEIAEFGREDIRLFPALLEPYAMQKGIWGILPRARHLVLLVDFQLLLKHKPQP